MSLFGLDDEVANRDAVAAVNVPAIRVVRRRLLKAPGLAVFR